MRRAPRFSSVLLAGVVASMVAMPLQSQAAEPAEATITLEQDTVTWEGSALNVVQPGPTGQADAGTEGCPPSELDPENAICDHFTFTVDLPAEVYEAGSVALTLTMTFTDGDDWDFSVYRPGGTAFITSAATSDNPEVITLTDPEGTYELRGAPFLALEGYSGVATLSLVSNENVADPRSPGFQAFHPTTVSGAYPEEDFDNPVADYDGTPLKFSSHDVGRSAREPTVAVDLDGDVFVAAAGFDAIPDNPADQSFARTKIMRSSDGGASFQSVSPTLDGGDTSMPPISGDPYVWVDEATGRVFSIDLLQLANNYVMFTDDDGESWTTSPLDISSTVTDHQTLVSGPAPAALAPLAVGPGFEGRMVYYCFNRIAESVCTRSFDGGVNFARTGAPVFTGVDPAEYGAELCGGLHGHIAVDNAGRLLLPKGHCNQPWLAVSEDGGTTWRTSKVADVGFPEQQASVWFDTADNYYYVWYDDVQQLPYLAISTDQGLTWSDPMMIAPPGVTEVQWPTVYAGDPGRVSVGFPCNRSTGADSESLSRPWDYCIVMSTNALDETPTFISNIGNPVDDPMHRGLCPGRCGNALDFLDLIAAPQGTDGRIWASYTDTCTANVFTNADGAEFPQCNITPTALGFDGNLDNAANDDRGFAVKQVCGPNVWLAAEAITDDCVLAAGGDSDQAPAPGGDQPQPAPAPPSSSPLPATGGGLAALGAAALGSTLLLRRRARH